MNYVIQKKIDLNAYGVEEMSKNEMVETDGGLFWFVVIAAVALASSGCSSKNIGGNNYQGTGDQNITIINNYYCDSTTYDTVVEIKP